MEPAIYDIIYFVTLFAEILAIEYIIKRPVLCDILPFTTFLVQNYEVSYMTGSTVLNNRDNLLLTRLSMKVIVFRLLYFLHFQYTWHRMILRTTWKTRRLNLSVLRVNRSCVQSVVSIHFQLVCFNRKKINWASNVKCRLRMFVII